MVAKKIYIHIYIYVCINCLYLSFLIYLSFTKKCTIYFSIKKAVDIGLIHLHTDPLYRLITAKSRLKEIINKSIDSSSIYIVRQDSCNFLKRPWAVVFWNDHLHRAHSDV